jgi:hypothetical protein
LFRSWIRPGTIGVVLLEAIMVSNPRIAFILLKRLCFMLDERLHDCYCAMGAT